MNEHFNSSDVIYSILEETQLEKFWPRIRDDLQISRISHFDYVKSKDLEKIGIGKPAARRLLDYVKKIKQETPKNEFSKINKNESINKDVIKKSASLHLMNEELPSSNSASFIINENDLQISNDVLGSGHFGIVKKAIWSTPLNTKLNVAVKILKENILSESKKTLNDFLSEISYMCNLNDKNLTKLYGLVLTTQSKSIMMVTELAPMGSLLNYLKLNSQIILLTSLNSYSYQIVSGMEYLESKMTIHRDLASRNILLFSLDKVKICDFGMMRRLNDKNEYFKIETNSKVPYSWYPPESLRKKVFGIKSDVWAFAATLYEIYMFGERPWVNLTSSQILEKIENNERLKKPFCCSTKVYSILLKCWLYDPDQRPSFQTLSKQIRDAYPIEMKAKDNFNEPNRLDIKKGDTLTIIDGQANKYYWFGQNNRTFKYGYFPRMILDPQRKLNSADISLPLKHSFIHTGHCSGNVNKVWGFPDKIDEIFLKNPLIPPDLLTNLDDNNCLIDLNNSSDNYDDNNTSLKINNKIPIYYNNQDYIITHQINQKDQKKNDIYENNEFQSKFKSAPSRPPPPIIKSHSPILKPQLPEPQEQCVNNNNNNNNNHLNIPKPTLLPNREFKKHEFKANFDKNNIDFDEFLNKVMNDALIELSNNKKPNENQKNKKNPFFYSQQTLIQNERLPLDPPPLTTIDSSFSIDNTNNHLYENFNDTGIKNVTYEYKSYF